MIRDLGAEQVEAHLAPYPGTLTPQAVYSADLTLRYLPDLLQLAKGLAPDDVLVACLKNTLSQWPFSSVGTEGLEAQNLEPVLAHESLKYAYTDRIIKRKDTSRAQNEAITELIREALGAHAPILWPGFDNTHKTP
jgi:hypothetical protein